jgi:hypothetical protein
MFKKYLKDESGDAHAGTIIMTGIFIGAGVIMLALTYGVKVTAMLNALGNKF